jgi:hypothetical protein
MTAKIITIPTLVLVALIAACSSSGAADQAPVPTQAALTPTPLQTPTSTEVTAEPAGGECSPLMIDGKLRILADSWSLVVAAKGESDEEDMLKEFQDGASDMVEDFEDADGCKGSKESTAAAELNYQTSILAAQILVEQPEDRVYTMSPPPATRSLMRLESTVLSSSKQHATGALRRPQTAQLSAKHRPTFEARLCDPYGRRQLRLAGNPTRLGRRTQPSPPPGRRSLICSTHPRTRTSEIRSAGRRPSSESSGGRASTGWRNR